MLLFHCTSRLARDVRRHSWSVAALAAMALLSCAAEPAHAQTEPPPPAGSTAGSAAGSIEAAAAAAESRFALYGQATYTEQETDGFHAPYAGPNSLSPSIGRETADATLYLGARLWRGAELWLNPEVDQGFGLDDTLGLAGFSSGEAYKVGRKAPYFRLQRAFFRQTINLGAVAGETDAGPNQLAAQQSADRLVVTVGKLSVVDIFDVNRYAHDPRADFLNWSVIDAGTFDYAADAWGYSVGGAAEWYTGPWAWRAGVFDLSAVPNSTVLEPGFHEYQVDLEAEHRHEVFGQPGKVDVTVFREPRAHGSASGCDCICRGRGAAARSGAGAPLSQARWGIAQHRAAAHGERRDVCAAGRCGRERGDV